MNDYEKIKGFIQKQAAKQKSRAPIEADTQLLAEGVLDSFGVLELVAFVEDAFAVQFKKEELKPENFASINAILAHLKSRESSRGKP